MEADDVDFLCVYIYFFVRESRAVYMEFLCVVAGKHVWSVCVDLHILDNGGYVTPGFRGTKTRART
jgi:exosome complex RNA-binding protein Rrp42 (RNase PH superfamily)